MAFSIESAKAVITHPALTYNFILDGIPNVNPINITGASIPKKDIDDIKMTIRGRELHYNGNIPKFGPMNVTFFDDISYTTRTSLELWMQVMADNETGYGFLTPLVQKDLTLYVMAPGSDIVIASYVLHNAFITNLGDVTLNYSDTTKPLSYSGTIVYDYFTRKDIAGFSNITDIASSLGING